MEIADADRGFDQAAVAAAGEAGQAIMAPGGGKGPLAKQGDFELATMAVAAEKDIPIPAFQLFQSVRVVREQQGQAWFWPPVLQAEPRLEIAGPEIASAGKMHGLPMDRDGRRGVFEQDNSCIMEQSDDWLLRWSQGSCWQHVVVAQAGKGWRGGVQPPQKCQAMVAIRNDKGIGDEIAGDEDEIGPFGQAKVGGPFQQLPGDLVGDVQIGQMQDPQRSFSLQGRHFQPFPPHLKLFGLLAHSVMQDDRKEQDGRHGGDPKTAGAEPGRLA